MERDFWLSKWRKNEIGFHQSSPTPHLVRFAERLGLDEKKRVLVPLCGKAHDLRWLADHGHEVVGVELSDLAVRSFFEEQGLAFEQTGNRFASGPITLFAADFFDVRAREIGSFDAVFDRAALCALPGDQRERYAAHLWSLLKPGARMLLVAFEYEASLMNGPPFAVLTDEVQRLYAKAQSIELLERTDVLEAEPRFKARGLTWLREALWLITR
jgi:thiopurine S-methyltransferase